MKGVEVAIVKLQSTDGGAGVLVAAGGPQSTMVTMQQHEATAHGQRQRIDHLAESLEAFRGVQSAGALVTEARLNELVAEAKRVVVVVMACETNTQTARAIATGALVVASESSKKNISHMQMITVALEQQLALEERVRFAFVLGNVPPVATTTVAFPVA